MLAQQRLVDCAANNLANATTPGYRNQRAAFGCTSGPPVVYVNHDPGNRGGLPQMGTLLGRGAAAVSCDGTALDHSVHALEATGNPLDVAIEGEGFLVVAAAGSELLRRSGSLIIRQDGWLTDSEGNRVLGVAGPLRLTPGRDLVIAEDGTVTQTGSRLGQLRVVGVMGELSPVGEGLYQGQVTGASGYAVRQGYLEMPRGNVISQMIALIEAFRVYEAGQKAVQAADETLGWAVREVSTLA